MSAREVDAYLRRLEEPKRGTLQALRRTILEIVPDAEEVISYRVPGYRVGGKTVAGFPAFKDHLSCLDAHTLESKAGAAARTDAAAPSQGSCGFSR